MVSVTRQHAPHRVRRAGVRHRILQATDDLLTGGERFTAIPVERIIADADVARSSFYVHFPDKAALLGPLVEQAVADVTAAAERWWIIDRTSGPAAIAPILVDLIAAYRRQAHLLRALAEVAGYDDNVRDLWRIHRASHAAFVAERLAADQRDGRVDAGTDLARTADILVTMIDSAILDHVARGAEDHDAFAAALARTSWLAVYGR